MRRKKVLILDFNCAVEVLGNREGWVTSLKCIQMELGAPDASGRRRPTEVVGSKFTIAY